MYDRSTLRAVAKAAGVANSNQLAIKLRLPRNTAWRLWEGHAAPTAATAAAVQLAFGLPTAALLIAAPRESEPAA